MWRGVCMPARSLVGLTRKETAVPRRSRSSIVWSSRLSSERLTQPMSWAFSHSNANGCTRGPWSRPQAGTFGNVARDSFFGPHLFNADLSLSKVFRITEKVTAQFRAESFNTFNHANLGQPNATVDSPTAGQITSIQGLTQMRKWQFGLRANF